MAKYDEIEIIKRAYDELKALDRDGQIRAIEWLAERLDADYQKAIRERLVATKERISKRRAQRT